MLVQSLSIETKRLHLRFGRLSIERLSQLAWSKWSQAIAHSVVVSDEREAAVLHREPHIRCAQSVFARLVDAVDVAGVVLEILGRLGDANLRAFTLGRVARSSHNDLGAAMVACYTAVRFHSTNMSVSADYSW